MEKEMNVLEQLQNSLEMSTKCKMDRYALIVDLLEKKNIKHDINAYNGIHIHLSSFRSIAIYAPTVPNNGYNVTFKNTISFHCASETVQLTSANEVIKLISMIDIVAK